MIAKVDDPYEKYLAGKFNLLYQTGKGGKSLVPVLIPNDVTLAMDKLDNMRDLVGVYTSNDYFFAYTQMSLDHCRGWDA